MKKIILALSVLFFGAGLSAQSAITITPGVGVNNLKLGMTTDEAMTVLEGAISWTDYEQQLESFAGYDTRVDSVMQFILGFDSCGRYESELPENMPVFALYFKNSKLNFITVSSYSASDEHLKLVRLSNGLKFYDAMGACIKKMGKDYVPLGYGGYNGDYYYYNEGVEMVFDENKLTSISIFPKTPDFKKLIAQKSKQLQAEAEKYK
jgi:hypothetical protein